MRKYISGLAATIVVSGVFATGTAHAAPSTTERSAQVAAASCVKVLDWSTEGFSRYVKVRNSCSRTACFSVTIPLKSDPTFSIGANKTQTFRYGGALWNGGTGIKNKSC